VLRNEVPICYFKDTIERESLQNMPCQFQSIVKVWYLGDWLSNSIVNVVNE
jgi:hypothetical protein